MPSQLSVQTAAGHGGGLSLSPSPPPSPPLPPSPPSPSLSLSPSLSPLSHPLRPSSSPFRHRHVEQAKVTAMETTSDLSSLSDGVSTADIEQVKGSVGRCLPSSLFKQLLDMEEVSLSLPLPLPLPLSLPLPPPPLFLSLPLSPPSLILSDPAPVHSGTCTQDQKNGQIESSYCTTHHSLVT